MMFSGLRARNTVHTCSCLSKLNPFIDLDEIHLVGGKLARDLINNNSNLIVLSYKTVFIVIQIDTLIVNYNYEISIGFQIKKFLDIYAL